MKQNNKCCNPATNKMKMYVIHTYIYIYIYIYKYYIIM